MDDHRYRDRYISFGAYSYSFLHCIFIMHERCSAKMHKNKTFGETGVRCVSSKLSKYVAFKCMPKIVIGHNQYGTTTVSGSLMFSCFRSAEHCAKLD